MPNPLNIAAASFWPGLQNVGQTFGSSTISGTLNRGPQSGVISPNSSNMVGSFFISLPDPTVVSVWRINLVDNLGGTWPNVWWPIFGSVQLDHFTGGVIDYKLIVVEQQATGGRQFNINFVGANSGDININLTMNIYGHLYSYPW